MIFKISKPQIYRPHRNVGLDILQTQSVTPNCKYVVSSLIYLCMSSFVYFAVEGRYFTAATFIYDVV